MNKDRVDAIINKNIARIIKGIFPYIRATGNRLPYGDIKNTAYAAVWVTVAENPDLSDSTIVKESARLFDYWTRREYDAEKLSNSPNRKEPVDPKTFLPWGIRSSTGCLEFNASDSKIIIREQIFDFFNYLLKKWGPSATLWFVSYVLDKQFVNRQTLPSRRRLQRIIQDIKKDLKDEFEGI